jgi:hypothetical protein
MDCCAARCAFNRRVVLIFEGVFLGLRHALSLAADYFGADRAGIAGYGRVVSAYPNTSKNLGRTLGCPNIAVIWDRISPARCILVLIWSAAWFGFCFPLFVCSHWEFRFWSSQDAAVRSPTPTARAPVQGLAAARAAAADQAPAVEADRGAAAVRAAAAGLEAQTVRYAAVRDLATTIKMAP